MPWRKKKWSQIQFDSVDWEHLDLALKSKDDMYRIWRSKQNSGFCRMRVQVGRYSGESVPPRQEVPKLRKTRDSGTSHAVP